MTIIVFVVIKNRLKHGLKRACAPATTLADKPRADSVAEGKNHSFPRQQCRLLYESCPSHSESLIMEAEQRVITRNANNQRFMA
ncbi:hypothetical protein D3OALGA1CA_2667 [Olavius algarvensis associated proteobacterium Delta 3]|nr:hypothetical protein D3OALGA1CA_2667 [Olavius algarvensis associated proteobacterium Delta 3]